MKIVDREKQLLCRSEREGGQSVSARETGVWHGWHEYIWWERENGWMCVISRKEQQQQQQFNTRWTDDHAHNHRRCSLIDSTWEYSGWWVDERVWVIVCIYYDRLFFNSFCFEMIHTHDTYILHVHSSSSSSSTSSLLLPPTATTTTLEYRIHSQLKRSLMEYRELQQQQHTRSTIDDSLIYPSLSYLSTWFQVASLVHPVQVNGNELNYDYTDKRTIRDPCSTQVQLLLEIISVLSRQSLLSTSPHIPLYY